MTDTKIKSAVIDELSNGLKDILWRLKDIREILMSSTIDGRRCYGCDEWSVPIVNLDIVIKRLEGLENNEVTK